MEVGNAYMRAGYEIGVCLRWGFIGAALGTGSGSLAALALSVQQKAGLIFGAVSGGSSLPIFRAVNRASAPFRTAATAVASIATGTAAGYAVLNFADEPPSPKTLLRLAFLTYSFGLTTLTCARCIASRQKHNAEQPIRTTEEEYRVLETE